MTIQRWVLAWVGLIAAGNAWGADGAASQKYVFGVEKEGYVTVREAEEYSTQKGFGFESGAQVNLAGGVLMAAKPFYFSVAVPEGNYRVTLTAGAADRPTDLTVKAELRRLMIELLKLEPGRTQQVSFVVNVRRPEYSGEAGEGSVRLKAPRETVEEAWAWDEKLTLEFNGARPNIQAIAFERVDVPTVYLMGDSTVTDQAKEPWNSWGQMFTRFFKDDIAVANYAQSGETVASSLAAHRFDKVYSRLKPGDTLMLQFGHNDMKPGAVPLERYKAEYRNIIEKTRAKGATPVVISSVERKSGLDRSTLNGYPEAAEEVARATGTAFIDLHGMSQQLYKGLGTDLDKAFQDGTHHTSFGSYEVSKLVLEGVRRNKLELAKHIREDVLAFDPAKPGKTAAFVVPASPGYTNVRPLGD